MRPLLRRVPQLQRLAVFDAVAATGGFTAAARDLEMSQPAISRHIANLERQLGTALFERTGGSAQLTHHGRRFADGVHDAFERIERSLAELAAETDALVLAVQPAMATSWIVPNLERLTAAADTDVRLLIFDRSAELDRATWDVAIMPGAGEWPGITATELFTEVVQPLASPSFAEGFRLHADSTPDDLRNATLLHIDDIDRPSMTWREWFVAAGCSGEVPAPKVVYDTYPTVLQEALVGHGVVLGWQHLIGDLVDRGLLVPVGPAVGRPSLGHYVCWRRTHDGDPRCEAIRNLLLSQFSAEDARMG